MASKEAAGRGMALQGVRVLFVEDAGLIGMWAQSTLEASGMTVLGPATRVSEALRLAEAESFEIALLDIDLNGEFVWPVADVLAARGVPFAFTTGFEGAIVVPDRFSSRITLAKPYREEELVSLAHSLLASTAGATAPNLP